MRNQSRRQCANNLAVCLTEDMRRCVLVVLAFLLAILGGLVLAGPGGAQPPSGLWRPTQIFEWQWELNHPLRTNNPSDMGTGVTAWDGTRPPATNPTVYDIDGIENPASTVTTLHGMGDRAICYIEVGTAGPYYSAADEGIPVSYYDQLSRAGVLGNKLPDYNERFIDINSPAAVAIIESMISEQCEAKGFDAVETDLDTTFNNLEGRTGFDISQQDEETYLGALATYMNEHGLVWFAKNLFSTERASFVNAMEPFAAGIVDEQGSQYGSNRLAGPFLAAGKPVLDVEFSYPQNRYCQSDIDRGIVGTTFRVALSGYRLPCA